MVQSGLIDESAADQLMAFVAERGLRVPEAARRLELTSPQSLSQFLADDSGLMYVNLREMDVPANIFFSFPDALMEEYGMIPISFEEEAKTIGIFDPTNIDALDAARFNLSGEITFVCCEADAIEELKLKHLGDDAAPGGSPENAGITVTVTQRYEDDGQSGEEEVVRYVDEILGKAIVNKASDIHFEPLGDGLRIRFRIDGVCYDRDYLSENRQGPVIARLKILAGMDITERRTPQEGRIEAKAEGREIDIRVSSLPTNHGESMVLRLLDRSNLVKGIKDLGFGQGDYDLFMEIVERPDGIVLVTGPTGSGKTTTLYSALRETKKESMKTVTVEDPVEFTFDGITQIPIQGGIGLDFPRALRSILRHDPDVILVGEIRDLETSETAMRAALTGHKVYSTLHTNDAPSAISRLLDLGAEPFLVVASVQACMSQRLVRRLCDHCKEEDHVTHEELLHNGFPVTNKAIQLFKPVGCHRCFMTGYVGRIAIFEIMDYSDKLKAMTLQRCSREETRRIAIREGMHSLRMDGFLKATEGVTSLAEVMRVAQKEETDTDPREAPAHVS